MIEGDVKELEDEIYWIEMLNKDEIMMRNYLGGCCDEWRGI